MLVEIEVNKQVIRGYIQEIITKTNQASKVRVSLKTGEIGHVIHIVTREEMEMERFKYYNQLFHAKGLSSIWDRKQNKYFVLEELHPTLSSSRRYAYLFTDQQIANDVLSSLNDERYMLRELNPKRKISENFKTLELTHYRINEERKVTVQHLDEREHNFQMAMPTNSRRNRR